MPELLPDTWLSDQLSRRAHRLVFRPGERFAGDDTVPECRALRSLHERDFCYCKVPVERVDQAKALVRWGFYLVDTAVQLRKQLCSRPPDADARCRPAAAHDVEEVARVAERSFVFSRFHQDPAFDRATADMLKSHWARGYFTGQRGDRMVVAEQNGRTVGFCQLLVEQGDRFVIDLIAVDPDYRRRGIGRALCAAAERECGGVREGVVGTQVANSPSVRMYEGLGYRLASASYVFHLHGRAHR